MESGLTLIQALQSLHEGPKMSNLARHQELQGVLRARVVAKIDQPLVHNFGARFCRNVAAKIDIQLSGDLEVIRCPGSSH